MKPLIAYYNGTLGAPEEIFIPISDRSIFFGDAVYDAALVRNGKIFLEDEHVFRILKCAEKLKIEHKYTAETLKSELRKCIGKFKDGLFFLYFQLSRRGWRKILMKLERLHMVLKQE